MNIAAIRNIVDETTRVYRDGPEIVEREDNHLRVREVYGYPHVADREPEFVPVGMVFVTVGVNVEAGGMKQRFIDAIGDGIGPETGQRLSDGPSYIHLGADLGSQEVALRFMALGDRMGLWKVMRPSDLGVPPGEQERMMAGQGLLFAIGWNPVVAEDTQP